MKALSQTDACGVGRAGQYLPIAVVALAGILLSGAAFQAARAWEQRRAENTFRTVAESLIADLEVNLAYNIETLQFVRRFYGGSQAVDRDEFEAFLCDTLASRRGGRAVAWVPRVAAADRDVFEAAVRAEGFPTFTIVPEGDREEYYPLDFISPYEENAKAHGYDIASDAHVRRVLEQACESPLVVASIPRPLAPYGGEQSGIYFVLAVHAKEAADNADESQPCHVDGFVVAVIEVPELVQTLAYGRTERHLYLTIDDVTDTASTQRLYASASLVSDLETDSVHVNSLPGLDRRLRMDIGGRTWSLRCWAGPGFEGAAANWPSYGVLMGGLLLTGILSAYLLGLRNRAAYVAHLVDVRTADLADACEQLQVENTRRQEAETARKRAYQELEDRVERRTRNLKDMNERLQAEMRERSRTDLSPRDVFTHDEVLLAAIPDIIMVVNREQVYTWANAAGLLFFGEHVVGTKTTRSGDSGQALSRGIQAIFEGRGDVVRIETAQRRRDGAERQLVWRCRGIRDAQGRTTGAVLVGRDSTDDDVAACTARNEGPSVEAAVDNS